MVKGTNLDANTTLDGFRITKGNANGLEGTDYSTGGGIWLYSSSLSLKNLIITNNSASHSGGGLCYRNQVDLNQNNLGSNLFNMTNCIFSENSATVYGGGVFMFSENKSKSITNSLFIKILRLLVVGYTRIQPLTQ